ncbi:hypothetical protein GCM10010508_40070 [Streptomyces naganishii JCM 4654]|uniref:Uncharacterized protein n=1 Tax=Streptomyces naganishii JCM 4654 TaxID=1306179 RepID=A0A919CWS4_9ACTN|nr:hypothetical protein GCM10010508_40070 [Streptomyces naganishii JCM 4654]
MRGSRPWARGVAAERAGEPAGVGAGDKECLRSDLRDGRCAKWPRGRCARCQVAAVCRPVSVRSAALREGGGQERRF